MDWHSLIWHCWNSAGNPTKDEAYYTSSKLKQALVSTVRSPNLLNVVSKFRLRLAVGAVLIALAVAGITYPIAWQHNQKTVGNQIVNHDIALGRSATSKSGTCTARPGPGVLRIPALGLTAPVESGTSDSVLAVALGHDPSTSWPGPGKSSLLAGHDVGFLSQDTKLKIGDTINYIEPCATLNFIVQKHIISKPFQHIAMPRRGGLILDSCWPINALWYTPQRYLVIARYVSTTAGSPMPPSVPVPPHVPVVKLPSGLHATDLTLATNSWPMGSLQIGGTPSNQWTHSQADLQTETTALELLFGLRHAISTAVPVWSKILAPGVSVPRWLAGTPNSRLNVSEQIRGSTITEVTLSSSVKDMGHTIYFTITATELGSTFVVTNVKQQP